jgi:putative transposase
MTLETLNERLRAFVEKRYHQAPHSGLMGRTPSSVYRAHVRPDELTEKKLREAFTVREGRRVSHDNVVSVDGKDWQLGQGFLAGKRVTLVRCWLEPSAPPCVELEGKLLPLHPVDRVQNGETKRAPRGEPVRLPSGVRFDPGATLTGEKKKGDPS